MKSRHLLLVGIAVTLVLVSSLRLGGSAGDVIPPTMNTATPQPSAVAQEHSLPSGDKDIGRIGGMVVRTRSSHELRTPANNQVEKPSSTSRRSPHLENGVLLLLHGGTRSEDYLVRHNLPRLEQYFLRCFPYPVIIFHEGLTMPSKQKMDATIPSANDGKGIIFEDISAFWKKLPHGISESTLKNWMMAPSQRNFQGRGYRLMCRFWHGLVWNMRVLDKYDYYWRLDTDAYITAPVVHDLFVIMKRNDCEYGFNRLKGDAPGVVMHLWPKFLDWAATTSEVNGTNATPLSAPVLEELKTFSLSPKDGSYLRRMFYNNFELGSLRIKRHPVYQSYFQYVDSQEPFGILRYRWGDAPLHTLGVLAVLWYEESDRLGKLRRAKRKDMVNDGGADALLTVQPSSVAGIPTSVCNITQRQVGYKHAVRKPPPIDDRQCSRPSES